MSQKLQEMYEILLKIQGMVEFLPEIKTIVQDTRITELEIQKELLHYAGRHEIWQENWQRSVVCASPVGWEDDLGAYVDFFHSLFPLSEITEGASLARFGGRNDSGDGAYIMADDLEDAKIAYSFGISNDVSWDMAMARQGIDVYMYDHTIEGLPAEHPRFHWEKIGLDAQEHGPMRTLPRILKDHGHEEQQNMLLKVDIEGMEWDVLDSWDDELLGQFAQIVIELHDIFQWNNKEKMDRVLRKINRSHAPVHLHGNNNGSYLIHHGKCLPDVLEVTYVLRNRYALQRARKTFPTFLDQKNTPNYADIILGTWGE